MLWVWLFVLFVITLDCYMFLRIPCDIVIRHPFRVIIINLDNDDDSDNNVVIE